MIQQIHDKEFTFYLHEEEIRKRIKALGDQITSDYEDKEPLFVCVLNGSFIFAADLVREVQLKSQIIFVKLSSYVGMDSSGEVKTDIALYENIYDRDLIILEDIVDTGATLHTFLQTLEDEKPRSIKVCTLLHKPDALQFKIPVHYVGFSIPNKFVVGYGLDYNGLGRNLKGIYKLVTEHEDPHRFMD